MECEVRTHHLERSDALDAHIERKLERALRRHRQRVGRVIVRIGDLNGPRGGVDKRCTIVLSHLDGGIIVVHADSDDAYAAVTQAAQRIDEQIGRRLGRGARADRSAAEEPIE
jgi:ribosomal subunit interface protein